MQEWCKIGIIRIQFAQSMYKNGVNWNKTHKSMYKNGVKLESDA